MNEYEIEETWYKIYGSQYKFKLKDEKTQKAMERIDKLIRDERLAEHIEKLE